MYQARIKRLEYLCSGPLDDGENYAAHLEADKQKLDDLDALLEITPRRGEEPKIQLHAHALFLLCAQERIQDHKIRFPVNQITSFTSPWLHPSGKLLNELAKSRDWPRHEEVLRLPHDATTPPVVKDFLKNQAKSKGKKSPQV